MTKWIRCVAVAPLALLAGCLLPHPQSLGHSSMQVNDGQAQVSCAAQLGHDACAAADVEERGHMAWMMVNMLGGLSVQEPDNTRQIMATQRRSPSAGIFYELNAAMDVAAQECPTADRDATLREVLAGCKDALASKEASQ